MKNKNFYMPLYFDDWIGGTYSMSPAARGAFIMVLIALAKGELVKAEMKAVCRIGGDISAEHFDEIMTKLHVVDGFLRNAKVERVMEIISHRKEAGRTSQRMRASANMSANMSAKPQQTCQQERGILNPKVLNPKDLNPKEEGVLWSIDVGWTGISEEDKVAWSCHCKGDLTRIDQELHKMGAWLKANPKRAMKKNWERFIVNWLSRSSSFTDMVYSRPSESNF